MNMVRTRPLAVLVDQRLRAREAVDPLARLERRRFFAFRSTSVPLESTTQNGVPSWIESSRPFFAARLSAA
ncbi:MAG: hypothetical protein FJ253_08190 [Phycisphaerae bacterium]|nr:hypothetical protein [Phycisphaerae bacterium]